MYAIIKFNPDKDLPKDVEKAIVMRLPDWAKSRAVILSTLMIVLVTFENISDVPLILAQLGIPMGISDIILKWTTVIGFIGAIIFRIKARQPLGINSGKLTSFTKEELADLRKILEEKVK